MIPAHSAEHEAKERAQERARPKKYWGQHFLHDAAVIQRIIGCIPGDEQRIVEIGPGRGALTRPLIKKFARLEVIERDPQLVAYLRTVLAGAAVVIHAGDVLRFDFSRYAADKAFVVGNLPYNISTPVLFHLLRARRYINGMMLMLQREVAARIAARPGQPDYGRPSVMVQAQCRVQRYFDVGPDAFSPPPAVCSSLISITPDDGRAQRIRNWNIFTAIVRAAFNQRRKKIRNALKAHAGSAALEALGLSADKRAGELGVGDYITIANWLDKQKATS